jgi:uncharacterized membrane protein YkvA (DUF1232 family)
MIQRLRAWARRLKNDLVAVALAARDPRTPWSARFLAVAVVAYALSPIDLIPDAVPVLGLLDDLILVPLGLWLVIRLIPAPILEEHRRATEVAGRLPQSRVAAVVIVMLWIALAAAGLAWLVR